MRELSDADLPLRRYDQTSVPSRDVFRLEERRCAPKEGSSTRRVETQEQNSTLRSGVSESNSAETDVLSHEEPRFLGNGGPERPSGRHGRGR